MPYTVATDLNHLRDYERAKKLTMPMEEVEKKIDAGAELIQECSSFSDPGDDWTAMWLEYPDGSKECIAFWPGY